MKIKYLTLLFNFQFHCKSLQLNHGVKWAYCQGDEENLEMIERQDQVIKPFE